MHPFRIACLDKLNWRSGAYALVLLCATTAIPLPAQTFTTLHSFDATDGDDPQGGLVQATNGKLYGTTYGGGANGAGTVFKITPSGTLTTVYSFCAQSGCSDGAYPYATLVQATNGSLYGTTTGGGANGDGTVFKITPGGVLTTLHSFDVTDGYLPYTALVQASNGDLYGTTVQGGANGAGTVFKITPSGTLTTLYSLCSQSNCADGYDVTAALVQATDRSFYGTTVLGGANCIPDGGCGTIFKITPGGALTTLYNFTGGTDGENPETGLTQDTNGKFYGTTQAGNGTIYSLSVGLGSFVETQTSSGKVGAVVKILGTDLTGATSVTFNGTAATFTIVSKSEITTTVPTGATTGPVKVVTPGGTLTSNFNFRVTP
jgi:uncharacterized repeat protein (TIGR03803 family)